MYLTRTMSESVSRRRTLQLLLAAPPAMLACSSAFGPAAFGDVSAGNLSALSVGTLKVIAGTPAILGRDANGVYAMTTTCTHTGCDMSSWVSSTGVDCNCHGSRFDMNGGVLRGPADTALDHFAVTVDSAGNISVHGGSIVAASVRLKV